MQKKIKTLIIIRHPVGGIRTYIKYTYGALNKNKYKFVILTVNKKQAMLMKSDLEDFDIEMVQVNEKHAIPLLLHKAFSLLLREKFELIVSHGFTAAVITVLANIFLRIPHIFTSHQILRKEHFPPFTGTLKRKFLEIVFSKPDVIYSVSTDAQENLIEFLPALKKIRHKLLVIEHGIKVNLSEKYDNFNLKKIRKEINIGDDIRLFGFMGRFMPQKGFVYVIDAVEELVTSRKDIANSFKVLVVNDGALIREYKDIINKKNLSEYFIFYGFVPNVENILKQLDALIMPSLWEACGLLAMEAFINGCPLISSDCIGLREVSRDTPALTVKQKDSHSIAAAMIEIINKHNHHKNKALEFKPAAKEKFNVGKTAKLVDELFSKTISQKA